MITDIVRKAILGSAALVIAAGCASTSTRPASRPMTETEQFWAQNLQKRYPGWRPPYLAAAPAAESEAVSPALAPAASVAPAPVAPAEPTALEKPAAASDTGVELVPAAQGHGKALGAKAAVKRAAAKPAAGKTYTVKAGDTLEKIAKKCYGKASAWKHILDSNHQLVGSPKKLRAGMVLKITPLP